MSKPDSQPPIYASWWMAFACLITFVYMILYGISGPKDMAAIFVCFHTMANAVNVQFLKMNRRAEEKTP